MFSKFTTGTGALIIPTQRIIDIADTYHDGCVVAWQAANDATKSAKIEGTAQENYDRLMREGIEQVLRAQARENRGLPIPPVPRGKAGAR